MPLFGQMLVNLMIGLVLRAIAWMLSDPPPAPTAGTQDDLTFPNTREGSDAGLVFGTVWRDNTQMYHHWTGDFRSRAIRTSVGKK